MTNSFNEYYINVASELITKLKSYGTNKNRENLISYTTDNKRIHEKPNLHKFMNITELEILKAISKLKMDLFPELIT